MSRVSEAEQDIQRLLAMTWRTWGNEPLDAPAITRTWSLDLGWLAPNDAETLLTKLLGKGWLISTDDRLSTNIDLSGVSVPLGWFPRQTLLDQPPVCPVDSTIASASLNEKVTTSKAGKQSKIKEPSEKSESTETQDTKQDKTNGQKSIGPSPDSDSFDVPALLLAISKESNLARQEVMRRAQRKRKSLGPVTVWMALILVARELQINIENLHPSAD